MQDFYWYSANAILATHFAFVLFVLGSVVVIWLGYFLRWRFVRNFYFRAAHLLCVGIVILLTAIGRDCPLTIWENELRIAAGGEAIYERGCITYWMDWLLFYEVSDRVIEGIYYAFFGLVILSFVLVKPRRPKATIGSGSSQLKAGQSSPPSQNHSR